jgi:hypothetical protein
MTKYLIRAGLICLFFALCLPAKASTATFQILADPLTGTWTNFALSGDGAVMAANYGGEIYRWTGESGFQDLGPGDSYSSSIGISRDGSAIISGYIGADGFSRPAIWNKNGQVDLGHPANGCTRIGNSWIERQRYCGRGTCLELQGCGSLCMDRDDRQHLSRASAGQP